MTRTLLPSNAAFPSRVPGTAFLTFLLGLALLCAFPSSLDARESREVDRREHLDAIHAQLDLGDWKAAAKLINRAEKEILHRSRPMRDDHRDLAQLALDLAVVEANLGDKAAAEWYWYIAYNLHQPTAYRDVSDWGKAAEVFDAIEVRDLGRGPKDVKLFWPYPGRDFEEPQMPEVKPPGSLTSSHEIDKIQSIQVEVFLDESGKVRSPRLMGRMILPLLHYSTLVQIFEKKWKPARSEGEPVPMVIEITQPLRESKW